MIHKRQRIISADSAFGTQLLIKGHDMRLMNPLVLHSREFWKVRPDKGAFGIEFLALQPNMKFTQVEPNTCDFNSGSSNTNSGMTSVQASQAAVNAG